MAIVAPRVFLWFVERGPTSYSVALGLIMLAMGLTLEREALVEVVVRRPKAVLFGCMAQYGIMPLTGLLTAKLFHLSPDLTAGLILLATCPGGTASNVVTYIAYGDVPLSLVMTLCATLSAVALTPALTQALAGTYVPVDAVGLGISTLQVVVLPVLLGTCLQTRFPKTVSRFVPFCPLAAVLTSSLLCCSVFSANFPILFSAISGSKKVFDAALLVQVLGSVLALHTAGFFLGYVVSFLAGYEEPQRRAVSIEVGMQNSSLGVVLASSHFSSPLSSLPSSLSAVLMNIMGSSLAAIWRSQGPLNLATSAPKNPPQDDTSAPQNLSKDDTSAPKNPSQDDTSASRNPLPDATSASNHVPTRVVATSASENLIQDATSAFKNPPQGATSAFKSVPGNIAATSASGDPVGDATSASKNLPENLPGNLSENLSENRSGMLPENLSGNLSDNLLENLSENLSKNLSKDVEVANVTSTNSESSA